MFLGFSIGFCSASISDSWVASMSGEVICFVFPGAAGHVNPSLPIARRLVQQGYQVGVELGKVKPTGDCGRLAP